MTWQRPARFRHWAFQLVAVVGVLGFIVWAGGSWLSTGGNEPAEITAVVTRTDLSITVTERGELESSQTVDVRCEVEGHQIKIVEILDEGTRVEKDQVVVRFDSDELSRSYAEQEIKVKQEEAKALAAKEDLEVQKNKAESEIAKKLLELELARLDRLKYLEGDYKVEEEDIKGAIALAERDLQEATENLEHYRSFVKKGFGTHAQLQFKEREVERTRYYLERDKAKLYVLQNYTRKRQEVELTAKAEEAERELDRTKRSQAAETAKKETDLQAAETTARLEQARLEKLEEQLDHCTVRAPQVGIVVYSKERNWDPTSRIRVGAMVHFQQPIFSLPDLTKMQVKVKIHESNVKKVKSGQKAEIRVDAYPKAVLHGTVEDVGTIADSRGYWDEGGTKEYVTIVKIEELPADAGLKPGMSAEVKVQVNQLANVLFVPVQAVAAEQDQHYCYQQHAKTFVRRPVSIGENNDSFIEIKAGLAEGARIALDARARLLAETKDSSRETKTAGAGSPSVPPT